MTALVYQLCWLAGTERDSAAHVLLKWFVNEQVEEEKSTSDTLKSPKKVGEDGTSLLILDERLARRVAEGA